MINEIKKGDRFVCIEGIPNEQIFGKVYTSDGDNHLMLEEPLGFCPRDKEGYKLFNKMFIPFTYQAVWQRYKLAKDAEEADPFAKLLLEMEKSIGRSTAGGGNYKGGLAQLPTYYNNDNGSLYKVATERGWNAYLFDIVKRLERGGKKDPLPQEIQKSIGVLQLWLEEIK